MKKIVFLDRDGVINKDSSDYIKHWEEFHFLPGSLDAIKQLSDNGYTVILITNQSVINRNMVSKKTLRQIHDNLIQSVLEHGGKITDIFYCPHRPDEHCACRKPATGLINQAAEKYRIDPARAIMIGDSAKDILCAKNAGCKTSILVGTGNGPEATRFFSGRNDGPDYYFPDLYSAVRWIVSGSMYEPRPLNTENIELPGSLLDLTELLAKNVHENWAMERMTNGWSYAPVRDDDMKHHPCLVPYEQLPEVEKEVDRRSALESLKTMVKLGYKIEQNDHKKC